MVSSRARTELLRPASQPPRCPTQSHVHHSVLSYEASDPVPAQTWRRLLRVLASRLASHARTQRPTHVAAHCRTALTCVSLSGRGDGRTGAITTAAPVGALPSKELSLGAREAICADAAVSAADASTGNECGIEGETASRLRVGDGGCGGATCGGSGGSDRRRPESAGEGGAEAERAVAEGAAEGLGRVRSALRGGEVEIKGGRCARLAEKLARQASIVSTSRRGEMACCCC